MGNRWLTGLRNCMLNSNNKEIQCGCGFNQSYLLSAFFNVLFYLVCVTFINFFYLMQSLQVLDEFSPVWLLLLSFCQLVLDF